MAAQCVTKVELTVSCENLMDKDIGSKSDPLCVLLMNSSDSQWFEVSMAIRSGFIQYHMAYRITININKMWLVLICLNLNTLQSGSQQPRITLF